MSRTKYIGYRPTWAEINLNNLAYNFNQIKKLLAPKTKIMVCIKADAYGHGLVPVAKRLLSCQADYLGVASIDEGIIIRQANINLPVLILGAVLKKDIEPLFTYRLTPVVSTEDLAMALSHKATQAGKMINVHLEVDTGMGRLGVLYKHALGLIRKIHQLKFISIEGIFTHLSCADSDRNFTLHQIDLFKRLIARLNDERINIPLVHAANSIGVVNFKESHFNMVRPGLIAYGLYPTQGLNIKLKPVFSLKARVMFFKKIPKGYGISYNHTYVTKRETTIVTLPIGYGDGYPRNLSNLGQVLISGRRFKISGRVCMDQIMVDIGNLPVEIGEVAVLIGGQGKNRITAEELSSLSGTIPYEIVCSLGSRIPRIYLDK